MRNILFIIGIVLLIGCMRTPPKEELFKITANSWKYTFADRNGEDYIRLWVNDTLLFSDTFHVRYNDSIRETWDDFRMEIATIRKTNQDSIKLRVRFITLDSVLFGNRYAVDTTFRYRIDNIPYMNINFFRERDSFRIMDPLRTPGAYLFD